MKPNLTLSLILAATLSVKNAPPDEMAMRKPAQSMPMKGMTEMMSPQPGFRFCDWIKSGITGNFMWHGNKSNPLPRRRLASKKRDYNFH
jgi:hypothetical protein